MTVLRGCHVFRLPYAFLKPNVNIRPSENRFARFCETKTDCRKTKHQRQPENRILGFRLPCCLSLQQLYFSPRRAKIPKLKSSRSDTVFGDTVPGKVIKHTGIQYRQQFAHTCRNGNLIRLTLGQQALIEIPNKRFEPHRHYGGHIQRLTHRHHPAQRRSNQYLRYDGGHLHQILASTIKSSPISNATGFTAKSTGHRVNSQPLRTREPLGRRCRC